MDESIAPNVSSETIGSNPVDSCFVCKVAFDRNLKKSRRRILRDRDDLVSPLLFLLWTAQRTGTWFSKHEMYLMAGPLQQTVTQHLQSMFACRKCFEKVIKLEKDILNFETEISLLLDQSCDSLIELDIIGGDPQNVNQLKNQIRIKDEIKNKKIEKIKTKKKAKVLPKKKKKTTVVQSIPQPQQQIQKTKQILVLAKAQEGDQQQLLVLQVPTNDTDLDDTQSTCHQITAYNPSLDHQYHNEEGQAVFLSSNAIPVTTCVTVSSDDHVLEVQMEQTPEDENDGEEELIEEDNQMKTEDETSEAVSTIPAEEKDWKLYGQQIQITNQFQNKRKIDSNEDSEDINKSEE